MHFNIDDLVIDMLCSVVEVHDDLFLVYDIDEVFEGVLVDQDVSFFSLDDDHIILELVSFLPFENTAHSSEFGFSSPIFRSEIFPKRR